MNEQQIEAAARKLCELRGVDPDRLEERRGETVDTPGQFGPNGEFYMAQSCTWVTTSPAWKFAATEIRARLQMDEAIRSAALPPTLEDKIHWGG